MWRMICSCGKSKVGFFFFSTVIHAEILVVEKKVMFVQIINTALKLYWSWCLSSPMSLEREKRKRNKTCSWWLKIMGGLDVKNDLFMWKEQSSYFLFFDCSSCGNSKNFKKTYKWNNEKRNSWFSDIYPGHLTEEIFIVSCNSCIKEQKSIIFNFSTFAKTKCEQNTFLKKWTANKK